MKARHNAAPLPSDRIPTMTTTSTFRPATSARVRALHVAARSASPRRWDRAALERRIAELEVVLRASAKRAGDHVEAGDEPAAGRERWATMLERQERRLLSIMLDAVIGAEFDDARIA